MKTLLALMLISAGSCLGAIPATTVWEVRTTGSDTNGGGFDGTASPSVDYSQNDSKNASGVRVAAVPQWISQPPTS